MKKFFLLITVSLFALLSFGQQVEPEISIIPEPVSVTRKGGSYQLPDKIVISSPRGDGMGIVNEYLIKKLSVAPGKQVTLDSKGSNADIVLNNRLLTDIPDPRCNGIDVLCQTIF